MLRDQLVARLKDIEGVPDYPRLVAEVLGIRGAPPELARRLVAQALVVEDRRESWRRAGERICAAAPASPGVYILRDEEGRALYVGKAINLRRRLRAHFAGRRWKALKTDMSRAANAEWIEVGSELESVLEPDQKVLAESLDGVDPLADDARNLGSGQARAGGHDDPTGKVGPQSDCDSSEGVAFCHPYQFRLSRDCVGGVRAPAVSGRRSRSTRPR